MGDKMDQAKGRRKEAAGALTAEASLKRKGKLDQLVSTMREKATKATEKMQSALAGKTIPNRTK